jgi:FtsP/CotA-like multicopper oxidase with cupredoxin domain
MDGVPGISFPGIAPGETFTYKFKVQQSGTYWYHSHTGFQEQLGMYGAIIIDPAIPLTSSFEREHVVLLSDWTDEDPMRVLRKLKMQSDYYNFAQPTVIDFIRDISELGLTQAWQKREMWNQMRMNPTDYADVSGYTYTYLMNGAPPSANWTALFKPGERVRMRFINGSTASYFDVRIPGLTLSVVSTDGQEVEPVSVDEFRIGAGETYDVIVTPDRDMAYTLFAQSMDRSGFARGTLAPRHGMQAEVPMMDKPEWLSMRDMMGDAQHAHGGHGGHGVASTVRVRHASTEFGPDVDMRVDNPRTNLDDPGVNLRSNNRHVLTYADLRTIGGPLDKRAPEREIELHLTGNMERYIWSIDGVPYSRSKPVHFRKNERLRVVMVNDTMMAHPFHLHGMWSELESADGNFQVRKHTINIQPGQRVTYLVTADAPGRWAWHCHLLMHMDLGMFREVVVD